MKKSTLIARLCLSASTMSAQVWVTDKPFDVTGVANNGVILGHAHAFNQPFQLWNPHTGEYVFIGGGSEGEGPGGVGRHNGKHCHTDRAIRGHRR